MCSYKLIFLFITLLLICSCATTDDIQNHSQNEIILTIIPSTEIPVSWDSTYYQHDSSYLAYLDTIAADSLAEVLVNSDLPITDFWYPNIDYICMIPIRGGSEVVVKLDRPDTTIYEYGFQEYDGFPVYCVPIWRHYEFIKD